MPLRIWIGALGRWKLSPKATRQQRVILSHGHFDQWGGLPGFLETHRTKMKSDLPIYLGGEDAFCCRIVVLPNGTVSPFGTLDRRELEAAKLRVVTSEAPLIIEGRGFTTGIVPPKSIERVVPHSQVIFGAANGAGCDSARYADHHFTPAEMSGQPQPDQHLHEHATCFNVKGRGLVVITSCGHAGIINTLRRAREVSGINKAYALAVESQQVVLGQGESADGRLVSDTGMRSMPVVAVHEEGQLVGALSGVQIGAGIGPFS